MIVRPPVAGQHGLAIKMAIAASVGVHMLLLLAPVEPSSSFPKASRQESVMIDLDYALEPLPEKAVPQETATVAESEAPPATARHMVEEKRESSPESKPVAKKQAAKTSRPKQVRKNRGAKAVASQPAVENTVAKKMAASPPIKERGNPEPVYPALARKRGQEGTVRIRCAIDAKGNVEHATVIAGSGHRLLDEAALAAVRQWRFRPAMSDGQPVAGSVIIPVEFRLR